MGISKNLKKIVPKEHFVSLRGRNDRSSAFQIPLRTESPVFCSAFWNAARAECPVLWIPFQRDS